MSTERRRKRREIRLIQNESTWLQKAVFALGKAQDAREKLADHRNEDLEEYAFPIDGRDVSVEAIEDALGDRIEDHLKVVRERRKALR